jgi:SPP1 gp7 family putative phage head morphogenesis protein
VPEIIPGIKAGRPAALKAAKQRARSISFNNQDLARTLAGSAIRMERSFFRDFFRALRLTTRQVVILELLDEVSAGDYIALTPEVLQKIDSIEWEGNEALAAELVAALEESAALTQTQVGLEMAFDVTHPRAVDTVRRMSNELNGLMTNSVKEVMGDLLAEGIEGNMGRTELRRMIGQRIGLTPYLQNAVNNYQDGLLAAGRKKRDAMRMAGEYADRLTRYRAEVVSRTEISRAMSLGQWEYWQQAKDNGVIPFDSQRVWITAEDERTCPVCAPMDGEVAAMDGGWETANGFVEYPSQTHPQCRCTTGLVFPDEVGKADPLGYEKWVLKNRRPNILQKGDYVGHPFRGNQWTTSTMVQTSFVPGMEQEIGDLAGVVAYEIGRDGQKAVVVDSEQPTTGDDLDDERYAGLTTAQLLIEQDLKVALGEDDGPFGSMTMDEAHMKVAKEIFEVDMLLTDDRINKDGLNAFPEGTKVSCEVVSTRQIYGDDIRVEMDIVATSPDGSRVKIGSATRALDPNNDTVENSLFKMRDDAQGTGAGTQLLSHWEDQYSRAGFETMTVHAVSEEGRMNGGYTWAKYGYEPDYGTADQLLSEYMGTREGAQAMNKLGIDESINRLGRLGYGQQNAVSQLLDDGAVTFDEVTDVATVDWGDLSNNTRISLFSGLDDGQSMSQYHGEDLLKIADEIPGFKGYLQTEANWFGSKSTNPRYRPEQQVPRSQIAETVGRVREMSSERFTGQPAGSQAGVFPTRRNARNVDQALDAIQEALFGRPNARAADASDFGSFVQEVFETNPNAGRPMPSPSSSVRRAGSIRATVGEARSLSKAERKSFGQPGGKKTGRRLPDEVLYTINRFMQEDPQAIERDEPRFHEALHRARLEAQRNGYIPR